MREINGGIFFALQYNNIIVSISETKVTCSAWEEEEGLIEIMKTTEQSGRFCAFLVSDKNFAMGQDRLNAGNNVLAIFVQTWRFKDILT